MFAIACGSDDVSVSVAAEEPTVPPTEDVADEPPADDAPVDEPPADDVPLGGGPYPIGTIDFVVSNNDSGEQTAAYTVSCLGDTATLTGDWAPAGNGGLGSVDGDMCLALATPAVQSRLIDGVPADQMCTQIYGSADFAEVTGELNGLPVDTTFARNDGCGIDDWDTVMAGLLPPATNS